jgi:hypothetical protein
MKEWMEEYEALVNYTDREIQKHSDGQTDTSPIQRVPPLVSRYWPSASAMRGRGLPPEPWRGQGTKGIAEKVSQCLLSTTAQRSMGACRYIGVFLAATLGRSKFSSSIHIRFSLGKGRQWGWVDLLTGWTFRRRDIIVPSGKEPTVLVVLLAIQSLYCLFEDEELPDSFVVLRPCY